MFSQQENHIPGTDARRRVCAYCCQEGDSSVKKITERALIGILTTFVGAQNRFRLETMGYAIEQVLTYVWDCTIIYLEGTFELVDFEAT